MPKSFPFTEAKVKAIPLPASGREYHKDTRFRGLQLCVTAADARTYYFVKRIGGRPTRVRLGTVEQLSVEQARTAAASVTGEVAAGRDPQEQRRQKRQEPTMDDLLTHWKEYAKAHKRSWAEDVRMCDKHFQPWANRKLSSVRRADVQAMHLRLAKDSGKYMANRVHELLRAMYNRAKDSLGYEGDNPALGIKRFSEEKRDRFLHADELRAFFVSLQAEP
ncbi:MAG: Arm DNA-binding domain-containing protein, partial [Planctomycetales bacterium]|nr:Arm DNA-binding domain-containing protein [Planctomycetales bacterium]